MSILKKELEKNFRAGKFVTKNSFTIRNKSKTGDFNFLARPENTTPSKISFEENEVSSPPSSSSEGFFMRIPISHQQRLKIVVQTKVTAKVAATLV